MDGGVWALQFRGGFEKNLCIWGFAVRGFRKLSSEFLTSGKCAHILGRQGTEVGWEWLSSSH